MLCPPQERHNMYSHAEHGNKITPEDFEEKRCLLSKTGFGQCTDFANLFEDALSIQGIDAPSIGVGVEDPSIPLLTKDKLHYIMLVKNWSATKDSSYNYEGGIFPWIMELYSSRSGKASMTPLDGTFPASPQREYGDLINDYGIAGQNVPTPSQKVFSTHMLVEMPENALPKEFSQTPYFDPSYGTMYKDAQDFQKSALFGYGIQIDTKVENLQNTKKGMLYFKVKKIDESIVIKFGE